MLLGLLINLGVGGALGAILSHQSGSRALPRLVFYSFSAPVFLTALYIGRAYLFSFSQP